MPQARLIGPEGENKGVIPTQQALEIAREAGLDLVEVSPPFDVNNLTSLVGANIAFEILCTMTNTN